MTFFLKFFDFIFSMIPRPQLSPEQWNNLKIIAHRGAHQDNIAQENTMPAFEWCLNKKIWGIEFDVRWTQDNIPVIVHDAHCERVFQKPNIFIHKTTFKNLQEQLPEIPSLQQVVLNFQKKLHLMIELKTELSKQQEQILQQILSELIPGEDYHLLSLKQEYLLALTLFPAKCFLPVAELNVEKMSRAALAHQWAGLSGHYALISSQKINQHQNAKQKIGVGFISSKNSLIREVQRGCDWIFTDHAQTLNLIVITESPS